MCAESGMGHVTLNIGWREGGRGGCVPSNNTFEVLWYYTAHVLCALYCCKSSEGCRRCLITIWG